ncbi:MAG: hypothetical protein JXA33_04530 [Anaerolineae bacterium]|nr:hypothetical protein [Anaerolineae bacterium]
MSETYNAIPEREVMSKWHSLSERDYRARLAHGVIWISLASFCVFLFIFGGIALYVPGFPWGVLYVAGVVIAFTLVALWILKWNLYGGVVIYLFTISGALFATLFFMGGVTSAVVIGVPIISWIAGMLVGRRAAILTVIFQSMIYISLVVLEFAGIIVPFKLPESLTPFFWGGVFIVSSIIVLMINEQFKIFSDMSLDALEECSQELTEMHRQKESLRTAEREARQREELTAQGLQDLVKQYVNFLNRVADGEYDIRLDLPALEDDMARVQAPDYVYRQLIILGRALNVTVDSLVSALSEVQAAQEAYIQRSWDSVVKAAAVSTGYHYRADTSDSQEIELVEGAWLPSMQQAIDTKTLVTQVNPDVSGEVAVPINWRDSLIGVLGVRRGDTEWNEYELAIINAVTDQLAQTIENLRLLDATTRQAAQDRVSGEIAARIRGEVDLEAVLERALVELGQVLNAERAVAHLALNEDQHAYVSSSYSMYGTDSEDVSFDFME